MSEEDDDSPEAIKVVLIGETGVGKTNLINAVKGINFNENSPSTVTANSFQKVMVIFEKKYTIKIWDTAGQDTFRDLNKLYYKDAKVVLLVYDITNQKSFDELGNYWLTQIKTELGDIPIYGLVGNKSDLAKQRVVDDKKASKFAADNNMKFKLCSGKDDPKNFNLFLRALVKEYIQKRKEDEEGQRFELEKEYGGGAKSCIIF